MYSSFNDCLTKRWRQQYKCGNKKMETSQKNQNNPIQMDYDVVYNINNQKIIQTRRRIITGEEHQAVLMIYDPNHKDTKEQEIIWKMYPRFGNYEGFLPANSLIVWMHLRERFDLLVNKINADKNITTKIQISEVDCYIANAHIINHLATHSAVQHQIIINGLCCGWRNKPADDGRYERIVFEKKVSKELGILMCKAIEIKSSMKSEICNTIDEYNVAKEYNKPIKDQLWQVVEQMYKIEDLGISVKQYYHHLVF